MSEREFTRRALLGGAVAGGVASVVAGDQLEQADVTPTAGGRSAAAPAHLLRASAITTVSDPWLPDGTHLRVNVSPRLGFPLHPFTAFRVDLGPWTPTHAVVVERSTTHIWLDSDLTVVGIGAGFFDFDPARVYYLVVHGWQWTFRAVRCCFVRLLARGTFRVDVLDPTSRLQEGESRVLASRGALPFEFGGTDIALLRVQGTGSVDGVEIVNTESTLITANSANSVSFGLPTGAGPWYVPATATDPATAARIRVEQGAAKRMGPPDRPDGTVVALTPAEEVARVQALSSAASGLNYWLDRCFTDQNTHPVDTAVSLAGGPVAGAAGSVPPVSALLAAAVDPAVARHLGLATRVDPPPSASACTLWLVAGLWLLPLDRGNIGGTLRSMLTGFPPPANIVSALYARYPGLSALANQRLAQLRAATPADGWTLVPLMAAAVAAKVAPDRPAPPRTLALLESTWRVTAGERRWTQRIPLQGPAAGGMLGLVRYTPGTPAVSLHRTIQVGSVTRARAMVAHWDKHKNDEGMVTDLSVPGQFASWGLWRADEFGRWSDRTLVTGSAPSTFGPPAPTVEAEFQPAAQDGGLTPRSPGALRIRIGLTGQGAISPGGSPVTAARLTVDGVEQPELPVPAGATSVVTTVAVRAFGVGEAAAIPVVAQLADAAGLGSGTAQLDRMVHDPRAYPPLYVAPTLLFAAERDPMGDSEVGLEWSSGAWGYRVYLGDELRLGGGGTGQRCVRAAQVWARAGQLTDRGRFTLVTPKPLRASPDGVVRFTHRLPGALRNVQFVRVVPVTSAGVETTFETCGLTPVAVPMPDRPPAPAVRVSPRADGRVDVTITATGLRDDLVAGEPQARLRRGRLTNGDPEYVPVVRTDIPLTRDANGAWSATVVDGPAQGFPGFVRLTWLAEVRYPAEPHLPAGATPADSQVHLVAGVSPGPQVSGWGPTSPPASTMHTPETQQVPQVVVQAGRVIVTNIPVSHRYAIRPHLLVVHRFPQGTTTPTVTLTPMPITVPTMVVQDTVVSPPPLRYAVVVMDPLNRSTAPVYVP